MAVTADTLRRVAALRNAVGADIDAAVRGLATAWSREWAGLVPRWQAALADVLALQTEQRWPTPWELARAGRVQRALQATEQSLALLAGTASNAVTATALTAVDATVEQEPAIIASQLPAAAIAAATVVIAGLATAHAVDADRARTRRQVTRQLSGLAAATSDRVRRALTRPRSGDMTADILAGTVADAFNTSLGSAITVARTEPVDAHRAAARTVHLANSATVSGWSWHCRCLPTSCIACWAMDGTEYPADEPGPLGHAGCRCVRLPIARSWRALGYGQDEPPSVIRPSRDVFDELTEADQVAILGRACHELLTSGVIEWADLATRRESRTWRPSYVPTPVRDLQRLARQQQPA